MKKSFLILFSLIPLTASCSGFPISRESAIKVIDTVEKTIEEACLTSYTCTRDTVEESGEETIVRIYSKENKFFHTYTITNTKAQSGGRFNESWRFVKSYQQQIGEGDEKSTISRDFIFTVVRAVTPTKINAEDGSKYNVTYEEYTLENWKKYSDIYEAYLLQDFSNALTFSRGLINDANNEINLKSLNGNSLHLNCKHSTEGTTTQNTEYELNFSGGKLSSIKNIVGETSSNSIEYKYSTGDIVYPAFETTIIM